MLEASDLQTLGHNSADYLHLLVEAIKLASADRTAYATADLATIRELFSPAYAAERRRLIDLDRAAPSEGERYVAQKSDEVPPGKPRQPWRPNTRPTSKPPTAGAIWCP